MKLYLHFAFANSAILFCLTAFSQQIGTVVSVDGDWCRTTTPLKTSAKLFIDDDVRYCDKKPSYSHSLTIRFDRKPPFEQTYDCTMPLLCDEHARLWLRGAYQYGGSVPGSGTPLLSHPNVSGLHSNGSQEVLPDSVAAIEANGVRLPEDVLDSIGNRQINLCSVVGGGTKDCVLVHPSSRNSFLRLQPGLYGVFFVTNNARSGAPNALLLAVPSGSESLKRWAAVPPSARKDTSEESVNERRRFILDLASSGPMK